MATTVDMRRQDTISETEKGEKQEQDLSEHKNAFVRWEKVAEWPQQSFQFLNDGFNCILRQLSFRFLVKLTKRKQQVQKKDIYMDILQPSRYKPSDLEQMAEDTKFTKGKLKTRQAACKRQGPLADMDLSLHDFSFCGWPQVVWELSVATIMKLA